MDNNNLPKSDRVIDLLEELGELEGQKAVLEVGPYTPEYVAEQAQAKLFEIAEVGGEIVQIVKDLEDQVAALSRRVADLEDELRTAAQPRPIWSGWSL